MLCDENAEPNALPLSLLEEITNGFSEERVIGRGGFAVVYKGILDNGEAIAVKKLSYTYKYEKQFNREVECLIRVKHKNVVRFIGYCVDSQGKADSYNGKFVIADVLQKLLCFEYLPCGTLDKYITDASCGLEWRTRYKIINGICDGLHYLHQNTVLHLDLKPPNILLDGNMLPKIADFGLSRRFEQKQSRAITTSIGGTLGYLAPEFGSREITYRFDLYSLGVIIIEILTGKKGYEDVDNVLESWSNRLEKSYRDIQLKQVRVCTEIGMECIESNPSKRPVSMHDIIARLHEIGNTEGFIEIDMTTSSSLQVKTNSGGLHEGGATGGTSCEDFSFSWSSSFSSDLTASEQISEVVLLAVTKTSFILGDEATTAIVAKLSEEVSNLKELPVKVEQIRKQLTVLGSVIRQIDTAYFMDKKKDASWNLIGNVRNVAFHVEDVMDKYSYYVLQLQREGFLKNCFIEGTHYVKVLSEIAEEVVAAEKETLLAMEIKDQWLQRSQFVPNKLSDMAIQQSEDSFTEFVKDDSLVGIEYNRKLLTGWLYSEEPETIVITVWGMGGIGKSTLVANVYEREKINFHAHAWIVVSHDYTVDNLLRTLLWKIGYTEQLVYAPIDKMDVYDLKNEIKQIHGNRKCLIVLDDVWQEEVCLQLQDALQNLQGSRILITTRTVRVAEISSPGRCLSLMTLRSSDAFELFCRRAFCNKKGHMCPVEFVEIAGSIVNRCQGMPLATVIIGSMLSSTQRLDIWAQKYKQLQSELSENHHVQAVLTVSYSDLPGDVRNCLLYCSLFPLNCHMPCDSLVRMWVAEGFVLSKQNSTPEVVAEGILKELIRRNFLELVEDDEFGRVNSCKMHGAVHDLLMSIAKEERYDSRDGHYTVMDTDDRYVRRLSLPGWKDSNGVKVELPSLRTVVSLGAILSSPSAVLSSILSESIYLTVLELQDSEVTQVPASIGSLFNLRYIGLRRTKVNSLPESIKNLSNLHTLDIKQTKVEKLPRGVVKIRKLRHLLADRYDDNKKQREFSTFVGVQAPENLSNLQELETLEVVESSNDLADHLKELMQLRSLWIENISAADCANIFATLSNMQFLSSLVLSAKDENETLCFKALEPRTTELCRLTFRGQWAKGTLECPIFRCHGPNLRYLDLSWCDLGKDPLGMLAPYLPNITYLKLANMHSATTLIISGDYFPNLKTLVLNRMPDVRGLNIMDGALSCVEGLYIISLSMFDTLPRGIASLRSLKKLWLLDLHKDFIRQWYTSGMPQKVLHVSQVRV